MHTITFDGINGTFEIAEGTEGTCVGCAFKDKPKQCETASSVCSLGKDIIFLAKEITYKFFGIEVKAVYHPSLYSIDTCKKCALDSFTTDCSDTEHGNICGVNSYFVRV